MGLSQGDLRLAEKPRGRSVRFKLVRASDPVFQAENHPGKPLSCGQCHRYRIPRDELEEHLEVRAYPTYDMVRMCCNLVGERRTFGSNTS